MASTEIMEFESAGEPNIKFEVAQAQGAQELSRSFRFTITLGYLSTESPDPKKIVQNEGTFKIKIRTVSSSGTSIRKTQSLHGVVTAFEQVRQDNDYTICRVTFESPLSRLALHRKTRTFPDISAKDVILEVLKEEFEAGDIDDTLLHADYPKQESFSQEEETNLNFVQRLMERYGITHFHTLENNDIRKLSLLDDWESFPTDSEEIPYYAEGLPPTSTADAGVREGIYMMTSKQKTIPSQVLVTDYNWRKTEYLQGKYPAEPDGNRIIHLPSEHFKTNEEGDRIAQLRYEAFQAEETVFSGESNVRDLQPGTVRTVTNWFQQDLELRIIRVHHFITQNTPFHPVEGQIALYRNKFVANPASAPYRPKQRAKKPVALPTYGFVDLGEDYSGLDSDGRYNIREPNHITQEEKGKGKASRLYRRMHPNAGPNGSGNNHPLHNETEVLLFPVGGDPDRKIIAGSLYNSKFPDIVNNANSSQSVRRTAGGIEEIMEDSDGAKYYSLRIPQENTYISMGADHHSDHSPPGVSVASNAGISMNAGGGVMITAGAAGHDNGVSTQSAEASSLHSTAATVAAIAALGCGIAGDASAFGVAAALGIAGDVAGFAGGIALPGVYVTAPGKACIIGKSEAILGGLGSADVIALGAANVMGLSSALLCGGVGAAVVSGGNVEAVSNFGDVKIHAKYRGNVKIEAKKGVFVEALLKNIELETKLDDIKLKSAQHIMIEADNDLHVATRLGKCEIKIEKSIYVDSVKDKKIELKAGNSSITMTDNDITIKAKQIILWSEDGNNTLTLNNEGKPYAFSVETAGKQKLDSDDNIDFLSTKSLLINGKKDIKLDTPTFDTKKAKKEVGTDHEDS